MPADEPRAAPDPAVIDEGPGPHTDAPERHGTSGNGHDLLPTGPRALAPPPAALAAPAPAGPDGAGDEPTAPRAPADPVAERRERLIRTLVDATVVLVCAFFVFLQLGPSNLLSDTTPAGGDMGAHVWGPAYLRDHLLPDLQLAGWAPDWYAGFSAYQFYMVLPPLLIVLLNAGVHGPLVVLPLAVAAGAVAAAVRWRRRPRRRNLLLVLAVGALFCVGLPYGVAFKLVTILGPLGLPAAAYAFGRLAGLRFPTPAFLAAATLPFLFYRGYTIYGGNIPSTLAGEFSFTISLCFALLYLGVLFRGLETGKHRALAAGLLALTGLCHVIPTFWALGTTAIVVLVRFRRSAVSWERGAALGLAGAGLVVGGLLLGPVTGTVEGLPVLAVGGLGLAAVAAALWSLSESVRWLTPTLAVGGLLAAFWVGPFYLRRAYVNDMGWEKLPYTDQTIWEHLLPSKTADVDLRWVFALALLGAVLSIARRIRVGVFLTVAIVANAAVFWLLPEGRLWNARVLPFYYLSAMLLAAVAVAEGIRLVATVARAGRPAGTAAGGLAALGGLTTVLVLVGLPLGVLPFDEAVGSSVSPAGYRWPTFSPWQMEGSPASFVRSWANWNYSGYEGKESYREYYNIVSTMQRLGEDEGCGRAHWEYEQELDRYGTPMALMLLPYWTDGCIGSMEGLYFESSATTPYHFLMQTELSVAPSAPQRDMPYGQFDMVLGVRHMQLMGVRYYMALSDQAIAAARANPDLTEVATSPPWVIFEVGGSELVTPVDFEPAVLEGVDDAQDEWLEEPRDASGRFYGPSLQWFLDPARWDVLLSQGGPDDWQRVTADELPEARDVTPARVSRIREGDDTIEFDVDRTGSPVLVKASYFPNWTADGAEGPWRVAPNLMVVVPTERHVELHYGRTGVEYLSYGLTLVGLVALVVLARQGAYRFRTPRRPEGRRRAGAGLGREDPPDDEDPRGDPPDRDEPESEVTPSRV